MPGLHVIILFQLIEVLADAIQSAQAVIGGFVYQGNNAPELRGKYLFADFVPGRVFYADTQEMHRVGKLATVMNSRSSPTRAKANGKIWKIIGTRRS